MITGVIWGVVISAVAPREAIQNYAGTDFGWVVI
jgi:hypothetical protein